MKKLLLFLLVLAGGVSTASAKTIYFVDNWELSSPDFKVYMYNSDIDYKTTWNNRESLVSKGTIDNRTYYTIDLDNWSHFVITFIDQSKDKQTVDLDAATYLDDSYIEFNSQWSDGKAQVQTATFNTYTFNVTTATKWNDFNIYLFYDKTNLTGVAWPGKQVTGSDDFHYTYTHKTYYPRLGVIFNQGNDNPQTGDLWAVPGDNNYYIASIGNTKIDNAEYGEGVKTNAYGYATHVSNKALTIPSGIAYYATDNNNGSATAHTLTNPAASTPMLIKGNANTIYHFAATATGTDDTSSNAFKAIEVEGEETGKTLETGSGPFNYILNGNAFYKANGKWVGKEKAYLQLSQAATARVLFFDDEEETTGITSVKSENSNIYFDLQGRRVAQPTKGLYIVNGKKYFAK